MGIVCCHALTSAEQGIADAQVEAEENTDGNELVAVLTCLFTLMLIRFIVGTTSRCPSKQSRAEPDESSDEAHDEAGESKANTADADGMNSNILPNTLGNVTNSTD